MKSARFSNFNISLDFTKKVKQQLSIIEFPSIDFMISTSFYNQTKVSELHCLGASI